MNITEVTEREIRSFGEHVSLVFEGREWTNVEMDQIARRLGDALTRLGVKRGDRVIIQMPNCPEVFQGFQAVWKIGAVVVPVNHLIGEEESAHIYQDSGAETIISSSAFLPLIEAARAQAPALKNVILIDQEAPKGAYSYWGLIDESPNELEVTRTGDDDLAALVYTSGTTGRPKGVMHTHHSLYSCARISIDSLPLPDQGVNVFVLPLCHMYGINAMIAGSLKGGGKGIALPTFAVEGILEAIDEYGGTAFAGVPTMYIYMLLYPTPEKYDLSSMRLWISGSAPLALETWRAFKEKYGFEIVEGWGLTETAASVDGPIKVGSIGRPMMGNEVKVIDDSGNELPQGQEGELIIRSPALMTGYWNRPEETAEVLRNGWVYTGDIGLVDEDGYFFVTDRKKDLIIKAGENIHPREVEEVLFAHPKVCEAAVVGVPDDVYGEDIKAFVVIRPGEQATQEEIIDCCRERLKGFKSPREVQFMDALPKNLVGKVLRKDLRVMP
jgi:long-chain acyl-CoA synthetase